MLEQEMMWYRVPGSDLSVMQNGLGELFVRRKVRHHLTVTVRVSPAGSGFQVTAGNGEGYLTPWAVNGLPAFLVIPEGE